MLYFFFQAEDGIRDADVTGVQTCALPIYSRWNMGQYIAYNIGKEDVIQLFEQIISRYKLPANFIVRNDNGSQFIASIVQEYFVKKGVSQEFTKPATPEQNEIGRAHV